MSPRVLYNSIISSVYGEFYSGGIDAMVRVRLENQIRGFEALAMTDGQRFQTNMGEITLLGENGKCVTVDDLVVGTDIWFVCGQKEKESIKVVGLQIT